MWACHYTMLHHICGQSGESNGSIWGDRFRENESEGKEQRERD